MAFCHGFTKTFVTFFGGRITYTKGSQNIFSDKNVKFWVGATEVSHVHTFTWTDGKTIVVDDYSKYDLTKANCLLTANPKPANAYQPCRELNSYICENSNYIRAK